MYERCHDACLEKEGYRKATIKNYVLVYKVDETAKAVIIYRFGHDPDTKQFRPPPLRRLDEGMYGVA